LSKRIPSVSSSSRPKVLDSSTVMTPSLPTLSMASAIISPIWGQPRRWTRWPRSAPWSRSPWPCEQLGGDRLGGLLDAALEGHRVGAGRDVAQALAHHGLGQDGGRRRAVTGDVVGLLGDLLDQLGADLLVGVVELDLLGDGHTVVGDRGGAPLLLQHDVAALRAQGDLDRVGEGVHAPLETAACLFVESDDLGHSGGSSTRLRWW
jgi:hypothetical protein